MFVLLADDYDTLCEAVPSSVSSFELADGAGLEKTERSARIVRAMALRKFVWGEDGVRGDRVVTALERSLNEDDRQAISHWHTNFASIGTTLRVLEGPGDSRGLDELVRDLVYGGLLHADYPRWERRRARSSTSTDLALWMFTEDAEFFVRRLRNLIRTAHREERLSHAAQSALDEALRGGRG